MRLVVVGPWYSGLRPEALAGIKDLGWREGEHQRIRELTHWLSR